MYEKELIRLITLRQNSTTCTRKKIARVNKPLPLFHPKELLPILPSMQIVCKEDSLA